MPVENKNTYVINIIGGPGVGKTTFNALIFANLKMLGYVCEYVQEYAKKLVWTKDFDTLNNQYYVSKYQYDLLNEINGHVDFIITDGPLVHGLYYNKYNKDNTSNIDKAESFILASHSKFNNINIVLDRVERPYEVDGRIQTEEEAKGIDSVLRHLLEINNIQYTAFPAETSQIDNMVKIIVENRI